MQQSFLIEGPDGAIEGIAEAKTATPSSLVVIAHPHPLYGGTMHNKVVTTLAQAYQQNDFIALRFNFRGVGRSEGVFDQGKGEQQDLLAVLQWGKQQFAVDTIALAGFSFGSYVALAAASVVQPQHVLAVAPPVNHLPFAALPLFPYLFAVIHGTADELVPYTAVESWIKSRPEKIPFVLMAETTHFFHGKLLALRAETQKIIELFGKNE